MIINRDLAMKNRINSPKLERKIIKMIQNSNKDAKIDFDFLDFNKMDQRLNGIIGSKKLIDEEKNKKLEKDKSEK